MENHKKIIIENNEYMCIKTMYSEHFNKAIFIKGRPYKCTHSGSLKDEKGYNNEFRNIECFKQHFN